MPIDAHGLLGTAACFAAATPAETCVVDAEVHKREKPHPSQMRTCAFTQLWCGRLLHPQHFAWSSLMQGCVDDDLPIHTLALYDKLFHDSYISLAKYSYPPIFRACATLRNVEKCREIHTEITLRGFESDVFLGNSLIDTYSKCGLLDEAREIFRKLSTRNVVSWNSFVTACADRGEGKEAWGYLEEMQLEGFAPHTTTLVCALKACGSVRMKNGSYELHAKIIERGWERDAVLGTALVDVHCKCGSLVDAEKTFQTLPIQTETSWTALIAGYAQAGHPVDALKCLKHLLQHEGISPDDIMFTCGLKACATLRVPEDGQEMHAHITKAGMESNVLVSTALVDMYGKCGLTREAHEMFTALPYRNAVSWTALLAQYAELGHSYEAIELYEQMQTEGVRPHAATFACGLKACGDVGMVDEGRRIHSAMVENQEVVVIKDPTTSPGTCTTTAAEEGFRMARTNIPGDLVVIAAIEAANLSAALVGMYSKCGHMSDAQRIFDATPNAGPAVYTALITGYARQADVEVVKEMVVRMEEDEGLPLDSVNCLNVLIACSHGGLLVHESLRCFETMSQRNGDAVNVEHYNCMIDLFGRAGHRNMAMEMVKGQPYQPNLVTWCSMLRACGCNGSSSIDVEVARRALEHVVELGREKKCVGSALICMTNLMEANDRHTHVHTHTHTSRVYPSPSSSCLTPFVPRQTNCPPPSAPSSSRQLERGP